MTLYWSRVQRLHELVTRVYGAARDACMRIDQSYESLRGCTTSENYGKRWIDLGPLLVQIPWSEAEGEALCDEEIKTRLVMARERTGKLDPLWRSRAISPHLKARLTQTLVCPIVTYGAEAWTLSKDLRCSIEAYEMQCYRRTIIKILYEDHVYNDTVLD